MRTASGHRSQLGDVAALALLAAVVCAVYGRSIGFGFLAWDDDQNIVNNKWLAPGLWQQFWYEPYLCMFIPPVYSLWYVLSQAVKPLDAGVFHAANVAVHAVNCWLVYRLAAVAAPSSQRINFLACFAALGFALHPVQVESVAWITGMRDMLSATGVLLAASFYLRGGSSGPTLRDGIFAWLAFVFAMLCKPSAVALPAALCAFALVADRRPIRRVTVALSPWFLAVIPVIWITRAVQSQIADPTASALPFWQRFVVTLDGYGFYLQKWLLPIGLTSDYGRSPSVVLAGDGLATHLLLLGSFSVACAVFRRQLGRQTLGWLLFSVLIILPTSGIVPFAFQHTSTVTDHYAYLAIAGLALALTTALARAPRRACAALAISLLAVWTTLSSLQLSIWRGDDTHFPAMVAANPRSYGGWTGLAALDMRQKDFDKALAHLLEAERLEPLKVDLLANKGMALNELGHFEQVLRELAPKLPNKQIVLASPISAPSVAVMFMMVAYANMKLGHNADALPYLCMAQWADATNSDVKKFMPILIARLQRSADDQTLCAPFIN